MKKVNAIIKNDKGQVCHRINDIIQMALGRNETLEETKHYILFRATKSIKSSSN